MASLERGQGLAATLARIILGVIFVAHGWQKVFTNGMDATVQSFHAMGAPVPEISAWFAALAELVGGALLIVGLAVPLVALLLIVDMIGAIFVVHIDNGLLGEGGYELNLALIAGLLAVGIASQGPLSVDSRVMRRRAK